tara:strand:+ start:1029 stop:1214 length:186 start_codon:yes stop_codon:yes gene_type:complete
MNIDYIQSKIISLRQEFKSLRLHQQLKLVGDIKIFKQDYIFVVWDYIANNISEHKLEKILK